ncbi:MAG: zinc ribbon domain-containing protein [Candidatus Aminicenantaceae bacterium]
MPIYEYRCKECGKKSTFVTLSVKSPLSPQCKSCGGKNVEKIISRVAIYRSEESRLKSLADPSKLAGLDENDPKSVARWMKKIGKEMGEDIGEDFDQAIEETIKESESKKGGESEE